MTSHIALDLATLAEFALVSAQEASLFCVPAANPKGIAFKALEGEHPYSALVGFEAPPDWLAIGMVAHGWAHPVDVVDELCDYRRGTMVSPPSLHPRRRAVRTASIADRTGGMVDILAFEDDDPEVMPCPSEGRIAFALRRALGLPSGAPLLAVEELYAVMWLSSLIRHTAEVGVPSFAEAAALHPAVWEFRKAKIKTPADLISFGYRLGQVQGWRKLQKRYLVSVESQWMDEPMLSQFLVGSFPSVDQQLDELVMLWGPGRLVPIRKVLKGWGLPCPSKNPRAPAA